MDDSCALNRSEDARLKCVIVIRRGECGSVAPLTSTLSAINLIFPIPASGTSFVIFVLKLGGLESVKKLIRDNGLSIALFVLFIFSLAGQYVTGWHEFNDEQVEHARPEVSAVGYLAEGHFWEALFENWESEFLQMTAFILLTVFLIQKGAADSREPGKIERVDIIPGADLLDRDAPWPVRHGGLALKLYENSLSLVLFLLFAVSFVLHGAGGAAAYSREQAAHGLPPVTTLEYMETSRFWFESFQNWQSEFLSIGVLVVLSIFLRQKGSTESKPVDAPYFESGSD